MRGAGGYFFISSFFIVSRIFSSCLSAHFLTSLFFMPGFFISPAMGSSSFMGFAAGFAGSPLPDAGEVSAAMPHDGHAKRAAKIAAQRKGVLLLIARCRKLHPW